MNPGVPRSAEVTNWCFCFSNFSSTGEIPNLNLFFLGVYRTVGAWH